MTHAELVERATRWLRNTKKHSIVLAEIASWCEQPDVIGWTSRGHCTLLECKTSRADFMADAKKPFRRNPETGLGMRRWYICPPHTLRISELPPKWGLAEVHGRSVRVLVEPERFSTNERMLQVEKRLLISACRRATEGWGRNVFGDISPKRGDIDPHPSVNKVLQSYRHELRAMSNQRDALDRKVYELQAELKALRVNSS